MANPGSVVCKHGLHKEGEGVLSLEKCTFCGLTTEERLLHNCHDT